jgi:3-phenylpropionate/trans-cinnamate dioxygenase ferredoxin reductase component
VTEPASFVVVGGGLAGAKTVEALRERGYDRPLVVVGDELELPYERPPLSKDYLAGRSTREDARVHDQQWYDDNQVQLRLGVSATAVDTDAHGVQLSDGSRLGYQKLLLATGATPRRLAIPGADAPGVLYLRRIGDSDAIRSTFRPGARLAVIGGGWIGLEVAAVARDAGVEVNLFEAAPLPLVGVLGPELAQVFADLHTEHGVTIHPNASIAEVAVAGGSASGVRLADGQVVPVDAVVIGVGVTPNIALAEAAGLAIDNGVLVDASLRTSDPDVYAAGDIANAQHPFLGSRVRVEHWANALNQPATAAAGMLGDPAASYEELPYFFTDQYDLGMEYVGHAPPGSYTNVVIRGELATREFIAFWLDGEARVLAGMNVNVWDVIDPIKAIIRSRRPVDADRLANPDVALTELT